MGRERRFGERFLRKREFLEYASALKLVQTSFSEDLLRFLERENMLRPIARVRFPDPVARALWLESRGPMQKLDMLELEPEGPELDAARSLCRRIGDWPGSHGPPIWQHILDELPERCEAYVEYPAVSAPDRRSEESRRLQVGVLDGEPLFCSDFRDDYYRSWQILQLAEVLAMRVEVLFDLRDDELLGPASDFLLEKVPASRRRIMIPRRQPTILHALLAQSTEFEAVSYADAYSRMAWNARWFARSLGRPDPRVADPRFGPEATKIAAAEAMGRYRTDADKLMDHLRWLCERWDDWTDRGVKAMSEEYEWTIAATAELVCVATESPFEEVAARLGRVTGHFKPTLKVVLPDWGEERQEELVSHFEHGEAALKQLCSGMGYQITREVFEAFARWIEANGHAALLFHYEELAKLNARTDSRAEIGYAKECAALALTFEHVVNSLVRSARRVREMGLREKLCLLWTRRSTVAETLDRQRALTRADKHPFADQWSAIEATSGSEAGVEVAKELLKAILVRNQGSHLGLAGVPRQTLRDAVGVLLEGMLCCWMEAQAHLPSDQ